MDEYSRVKSPVGIIINGPSCAGKSTIAKRCAKHLAKYINPSAVAILSIDDVSEYDAGITDDDSDDEVELKLNKYIADTMKKFLTDGKHVICDTIATSRAALMLYKKIANQNIIMCFIHNSLTRLIKNLEIRNSIASIPNSGLENLEKRGFSQVLNDFGSFYIPSEVDRRLGIISRKQLSAVWGCKDARTFVEDVSNKNGQRPGSPRPLEELMERFLSSYSIFKCLGTHEFTHLQVVNSDLYDLVINNEIPKISEATIFNFFCKI